MVLLPAECMSRECGCCCLGKANEQSTQQLVYLCGVLCQALANVDSNIRCLRPVVEQVDKLPNRQTCTR